MAHSIGKTRAYWYHALHRAPGVKVSDFLPAVEVDAPLPSDLSWCCYPTSCPNRRLPSCLSREDWWQGQTSPQVGEEQGPVEREPGPLHPVPDTYRPHRHNHGTHTRHMKCCIWQRSPSLPRLRGKAAVVQRMPSPDLKYLMSRTLEFVPPKGSCLRGSFNGAHSLSGPILLHGEVPELCLKSGGSQAMLNPRLPPAHNTGRNTKLLPGIKCAAETAPYPHRPALPQPV